MPPAANSNDTVNKDHPFWRYFRDMKIGNPEAAAILFVTDVLWYIAEDHNAQMERLIEAIKLLVPLDPNAPKIEANEDHAEAAEVEDNEPVEQPWNAD